MRAPRRSRRALIPTLLVTLLLTATLLPATGAGAAPSGTASDDTLPDRVLVKFREGAPAAAKADARRSAGAEHLSTIDELGVHVWRVPEHAAQRALTGLQRNPHVDYAELDTIVDLEEVVAVDPNDPEYHRQWGTKKVNAPTAWAISKSTSSVSVAILDTGVDAVPDLADKLIPGRNVLNGTSDVSDGHGHGTASAGVAGAQTDNGSVVAGYGWNASILPVKVMDGGSGTMSTLAAGIVWATDNGADVISMSLSGASGTTTVHDAVRYAHARDVVLVAAAGNQSDTVVRYPAAYSEVIAVAGTDSSDDLYSWSNYGSWVDVAAPGSNRTTLRDGGAFNYAGTSSATPAVAGVLALGAQYASGPELRAALQTSAAPLPFVKYGRVDAYAMLGILGGAASEPAPEPDPVPVGPTAQFAAACELLSCEVADQSHRGDAAITAWAWTFGDGATGSGAQAEHTYGAAGRYTVTLTVTDDNGATASDARVVEVTEPEPEPEPEPPTDPSPGPPDIDLQATGSKTKGKLTAHLVWSGSGGTKVDIYVDGGKHATAKDSGTYMHEPKVRGNPTVTYQVCDAGSVTVCSAEVTVSSW